MNAIVGIVMGIVGLLAFIIVMTLADDTKFNMVKILIAASVSVIIFVSGLGIMTKYTFKCCETVNLTNTCKVCGYKYDPDDEWICCDEYNYGKYCTNCGKERKFENEQYIYCCDKKYNINNDNYCSVCGEKIEITS